MVVARKWHKPRSRIDKFAWLATTVFAVIGAAGPGVTSSTTDEADACLGFIQVAEKSQAIPEGLLMAIGYTESGRVVPDGRRVPWPWTVNAQGQGYAFESKADAIAFVQDLHAQGIAVIDVGCMQVNLYYHPDAFASLDAAFDPATNVAYAAQFLKELHSESGDWGTATQHYHSRTPYLGRVYVGQVSANGFGETTGEIEPSKPLSAKDKAILAKPAPDQLTAGNEIIATSSAARKTRVRTGAVEQPVAVVMSGAPSLGGSTIQIKGSLN
jgi:hypothetical protein